MSAIGNLSGEIKGKREELVAKASHPTHAGDAVDYWINVEFVLTATVGSPDRDVWTREIRITREAFRKLQVGDCITEFPLNIEYPTARYEFERSSELP